MRCAVSHLDHGADRGAGLRAGDVLFGVPTQPSAGDAGDVVQRAPLSDLDNGLTCALSEVRDRNVVLIGLAMAIGLLRHSFRAREQLRLLGLIVSIVCIFIARSLRQNSPAMVLRAALIVPSIIICIVAYIIMPMLGVSQAVTYALTAGALGVR